MVIVTNEYYTDIFTASLILKNTFIPPGSVNKHKEAAFNFFRYSEAEEEDLENIEKAVEFFPHGQRLSCSYFRDKSENPVIHVAIDMLSKKDTIKAMAKEFCFYLQWLDKKERNEKSAVEFSEKFIILYNAAGNTMKEVYKQGCK